ncbi:hypothetical protein JCM3766R1_002447, partial [Sporobolomyces carnicolor]
DIAFVLNALGIAAVHVVANSYVAGPTSFAFVVSFPDAVLSLSILGAAPLDSMPSQLGALTEILEGWLQGSDDEWLFDAMTAIWDLAFSASLKDYDRGRDRDLLDWLANTWFRRIGPHRALRCFGVTAPILLRAGITRRELASIECPVLIVQGQDDMMQGVPVAHDIFDSLTGARDVRLEFVEGTFEPFSSFFFIFFAIQLTHESGPILTDFLVSHRSATSHSTRIVFPPPPTTNIPRTTRAITSIDYSRYDHGEPLCGQLWQLCNELDGKGLVTFADREPETWELGGRLEDMAQARWRFSQRHDLERATMSRRGSVPHLIKSEGPTTVVTTFEEIPLPSPPLSDHDVVVHDDDDDDPLVFVDERVVESSRSSTFIAVRQTNLGTPSTTIIVPKHKLSSSSSSSRPVRKEVGGGGGGGGGTLQFRMDTWRWETVNAATAVMTTSPLQTSNRPNSPR